MAQEHDRTPEAVKDDIVEALYECCRVSGSTECPKTGIPREDWCEYCLAAREIETTQSVLMAMINTIEGGGSRLYNLLEEVRSKHGPTGPPDEVDKGLTLCKCGNFWKCHAVKLLEILDEITVNMKAMIDEHRSSESFREFVTALGASEVIHVSDRPLGPLEALGVYYALRGPKTVDGYCKDCATMREFEATIEDVQAHTIAKGNCPVCGCQMHRVLAGD